jgi:hypothetical protein
VSGMCVPSQGAKNGGHEEESNRGARAETGIGRAKVVRGRGRGRGRALPSLTAKIGGHE